MKPRLLTFLTFLLLLVVAPPMQAAEKTGLPEPGPEESGLRMRLLVKPRTDAGKEGYDVRVDLLNTSERAIKLLGKWRNEDRGDVKDYIEAATSIECVPAIKRWMGGVQMGHRESPQPEQIIEKGEVLSVRWQTAGRYLKNRVTNPNEVQNPHFPFPGLYSVHATVDVITRERTVPLRSNEQLVSVGGSNALPKSTLGQLGQVEADGKTAMLSLGARHKIEVGDQFEHNSKGDYWKLTITEVNPGYSMGNLELKSPARLTPPVPGREVTLIQKR
jgi:hypothetical protein